MNFIKDGVVHIHRDRVYDYPGPVEHKKDIDVEDCDCNLELFVTAPECTGQRLFCADRFVAGKRQTLQQMWNSLRTQLSASYRIVDGKVRLNDYGSLFQSAVSAVHSLPIQNCVKIPPVTMHANPSSNKVLYPHKDLVLSYKQWDLYWFRKHIPSVTPEWLLKNVWYEVKYGDVVYNEGISWHHKDRAKRGVESLTVLAARKVSALNRALGGQEEGPHAVYTLDGAYPRKKVLEIKKYNRPTHVGSKMSKILSTRLFSALTMMYKCTGWELMKEGATYNWSPNNLESHRIPMNSSAGFRPGPRIVRWLSKTHKVVYHTLGKKREQVEYAKLSFSQFMNDLFENPSLLNDPYYINTDKEEILGSEDKEELRKLMDKLRQFNIPSITAHIAAVECNHLRHSLERGHHILIGHKWAEGGAYEIAKFLDYTDLDVIIDAADYSRYDKSISSWMLLLASSFSSYYYDNGGDIEVFLRLVEAVASNLSVKVVNLLERIWVIMIGVMPSGAFETSHTDSWINLMLFYLFCACRMAEMPPKEARQMRKDLLSNVIAYIVYGDDHLCKYPSRYYKWINVHERKKWLYKYCCMTLRDCEVFRSVNGVPALLTIIDPLTGVMRKQGPMFLQHYFIPRECVVSELRDLPPVLPYRKTFKTLYKFPFGSGAPRDPVDYVMASIGHVYDTHGTNAASYEFCHYMYSYWVRKAPDMQSRLKERINDAGMSKTITKLFRKAGVPIEVLLRGFPSRRELLRMNVYCRDAHINVARVEFLNQMELDKARFI